MKTWFPGLFLALALLAGAYPANAANSFKLQPLPFTNFAQLQLNGSSGTSFYVQISTNMTGWQNLWYDSFQSNTYSFVDVQTAPSSTRFYRGLLTNSPIELQLTQSNVVAQANPMTLVQIGVIGLTTNTPVFVQFYTSNGIVADVPPVQMTSSNITVSVPPLTIQEGSAFTNGLLNARIIQYVGNQAVMSKPFPAVQVQAVAASRLPPGTLTLNLLQGAYDEATNLVNNVPDSSLSNVISSLQGLIANVQQAVTNPSYTFSLGAISGQLAIVNQQDLQACDNLLVANLLALSTLTLTNNAGLQTLAACNPADPAIALSTAATTGDPLLPDPTLPIATQNVACLTDGSQQSVSAYINNFYRVYFQGYTTAREANGTLPSDPNNGLFSTVTSYLRGLYGASATWFQLTLTNNSTAQNLQNAIQQAETTTYNFYTNTTGSINTALQNVHSLTAFFSSAPIPESWVGTATFYSTNTTTDPNITPDPYNATFTESSYPVTLLVQGSLLNPMPFTGTYSESATTVVDVYPALMEYGETVPRSTGTADYSDSTSVTGTGDPASPTLVWGNGFFPPDFSYVDVPFTANATATIVVAPVTGIATLKIHYVSTGVEDTGAEDATSSTDSTTIDATLTRQ